MDKWANCCKCSKSIYLIGKDADWGYSESGEDYAMNWWCKECAANDPEVVEKIRKMDEIRRNLRRPSRGKENQ